MQLRTHPCMSCKGISNWPPVWIGISGQHSGPVGEVGVLEEVHRSKVGRDTLFLLMEYDANRYMGTLVFDDEGFCEKVCELLSHHCGKSIQDIGELDI